MPSTQPHIPPNGSLTQDFLAWEDDIIAMMKIDADHPDIWAIWQSAKGLCMTRKEHRLPHFDKAQAALIAQGHELATRRSGGTIVAQGEGILNVTKLAFHYGPRNISGSYMSFCEDMQMRFRNIGFETDIGPVSGSYCDGDYNLIIDGKKLAGTSQRWVKGPNKAFIILNHAVILITENGQNATRRVNEFHKIADEKAPYDDMSSASLWDSTQNKTGLDKSKFFTHISQALSRE
ncbi:MAG: hypothetical protein ABJG88_11530 [Litorimonas sp.]